MNALCIKAILVNITKIKKKNVIKKKYLFSSSWNRENVKLKLEII